MYVCLQLAIKHNYIRSSSETGRPDSVYLWRFYSQGQASIPFSKGGSRALSRGCGMTFVLHTDLTQSSPIKETLRSLPYERPSLWPRSNTARGMCYAYGVGD